MLFVQDYKHKKTNMNRSTLTVLKLRLAIEYMIPGFYPSTFVYSHFPPKIQFLYYLLSSLSQNLGLQFTGKCSSDTFSNCRSIVCTLFLWSDSTEYYWEF